MRISRDDLDWVARQGVISPEQAAATWHALETRDASRARARFDVAHIAWYGGALIVIGAMGLFITEAWSVFGGGALVAIALAYGAGFAALGHHLWHRRQLRIPGGLMITVAVTMTPLAVFGVQDALGWWRGGDPGAYRDFYIWVRGGWLFMELATIAVGLIALRFYRFAFLSMPVAVALWFLSMDLTPWLFGAADFTFDQCAIVSLWFGLAMLIVAWGIDLKAWADLAFWLHLFGLLAFWGGLSMLESDSELARAGYALINLGLLAVSAFLGRPVYAVFGTLGITGYLGYLASEVFAASLLFPFALSAVGVAVVVFGVYWYRSRAAIDRWIADHVPSGLRALRPPHANG